jgi:uncharacterized protein YdhG (YjbR/CyaY superfamily)
MAEQFTSIDEYIANFPPDEQIILEAVRRTIRNVVPTADEAIAYRMPTFTLDGKSLVHFAGWKHHISLYPVPAADAVLEQDLAPYRSARSTVRFLLRDPIPYDVIERVVVLLLRRRLGGEL